MSPRSDIPEPWRTAMENAGLYSFRALAEKARVGTTTVTGLVYGRRQSDEQTIKAVAGALRLKVTTIRGWASQALGQEQPFELPPEANRLTRRERDAVLAVVRAMLDPDEPASGGGFVQHATGSGKSGTVAHFADLARQEPDLSRVAARHGESEGRRRREEQDDDAGS